MRRRSWVVGVSSAVIGATAILAARGRTQPENEDDFRPPPSQGSHTFTLTLDLAEAGPAVNRLILGQNLQWTDKGDELLDNDGNVRPEMLEKIRRLQPTVVRFPGGAQSDNYRWKLGMGAIATRGRNRQSHSGNMQATIMGTQELLELCESLGAAPFITVNIITGSAAEAADWLRQTNLTRLRSRVTGNQLPKVPYWEIGNEPYLKEDDSSRWLTPAQYVARANEFVRALRAVDPDIKIGIPMRTEKIGGIPATPFASFAREALTGVSEKIDFVSNHNAYMPYAYDGKLHPSGTYWSAVAATASVQQNLDESTSLISSLRPGAPVAQAITEYNSLFTLGKGKNDKLISSGMSALYIADLLILLASREDVLLAQYWSLSGNFMFGAIQSDGKERPNFFALEFMAKALKGRRLAADVTTETFSSPRVGVSAPQKDLPLVVAFATRDKNELRILLINKDRHRSSNGTLRVRGSRIETANIETCFWDDPTQVDEQSTLTRRETKQLNQVGDSLNVQLRNSSLSLLTARLSA